MAWSMLGRFSLAHHLEQRHDTYMEKMYIRWQCCVRFSSITGKGPMSMSIQLQPAQNIDSLIQYGSFKLKRETMLSLEAASPTVMLYDAEGLVTTAPFHTGSRRALRPDEAWEALTIRTDQHGRWYQLVMGRKTGSRKYSAVGRIRQCAAGPRSFEGSRYSGRTKRGGLAFSSLGKKHLRLGWRIL